MDTNTCPACGLSLTDGRPVTFALPFVGNLRTGALERSGGREARIHEDCVGRPGRDDLVWKLEASAAPQD